MKTKFLFLLLFVPVHAVLSILAVQHAFNPPAGWPAAFVRWLTFVTTLPVLFPLMRFDPDGEILPRWFQFASVPLNSLIAGIGLLLVVAGIKRWRARTKREG